MESKLDLRPIDTTNEATCWDVEYGCELLSESFELWDPFFQQWVSTDVWVSDVSKREILWSLLWKREVTT